MRHKCEKVIVWWSFSTVLNKHNFIVKILGIILFFAEIHTATSHAIFIMILFEPDFHVFIELILSGQSLLWFHLKGNTIWEELRLMQSLLLYSVWRGISIVSSSSLSLCNLHCCAHSLLFTLRRAAWEIGIQKSGHK
jgi:hypothetical protein